MDGISKIIEELGTLIISKDAKIEMQQREIDKLRNKIEMLEGYLNIYEEICKKTG